MDEKDHGKTNGIFKVTVAVLEKMDCEINAN